MFLQGTGNQEKDVEDRFRAPVSRTKGSLHLHPSVPQTSVSACSPVQNCAGVCCEVLI